MTHGLLGALIPLIMIVILVTSTIGTRRLTRGTVRWRPRRVPNLAVFPYRTTIPIAASWVERLLRDHWANDAAELDRLDRVLVGLDSGYDYGRWDAVLGRVHTWNDELDEPIELDDRIHWGFQTFIDSNHCTAFNADRTRHHFLALLACLREAGIECGDADRVTFRQ
jgi:hypothetical protein